MKKMSIYEPAMCCPTGLCGVGVDPELLRVSAVINTLKKNGIEVKRYNLSNSPNAFVDDELVNIYINRKGVAGLPITFLDGKIIVEGRYPTNEEFSRYLNISEALLGEQPKPARYKVTRIDMVCTITVPLLEKTSEFSFKIDTLNPIQADMGKICFFIDRLS